MKSVEALNIFDDIVIEARRKEKVETDASIADTIAHQLIRSIEDKWDEDPIFFEKFSKLIQATIADFHKGRINELSYLAKIRELRDRVQNRQDDTDQTPARVRSDSHAQVFWGLARRNLDGVGLADSELAADIALELSKIIQRRRKVGWQNDRDVENVIRNDVDDFFFEELRAKRGMQRPAHRQRHVLSDRRLITPLHQWARQLRRVQIGQQRLDTHHGARLLLSHHHQWRMGVPRITASHQYEHLRSRSIPHKTALNEALGIGVTPEAQRSQPPKQLESGSVRL